MDMEFSDCIQQLVKEKGYEVLENGRAKSLLPDYCGTQFKNEIDIFKRILDAKCVEAINNANNVAECKQKLTERLEDINGISPGKSAPILDLLGMILRGDTGKTGVPAASVFSPAPDAAEWHIMVNNMRQGPYNKAKLVEMIGTGELTRETLVWKKGMAAWTVAAAVSELKEIFAIHPRR
jgi:hypothetical protein